MRATTAPVSFLCCRVRVDGLALEEAARRLVDAARARRGAAVHLCNAYTLSLAWRDLRLADVLNAGDLNLADGAPLFEVARRLRQPRPSRDQRPRGADLLVATVDAGRAAGLRHYLYGASPKTVAALARRLSDLCPGAVIVGTDSPPYRELSREEEARAVERIAAVRPDLVWVGLGTPRQDHVVHRLARRLDATVVAVGAAFDFVAGTRPQAPIWMRRAGLEWLHRLAQEPRRLARRYLVGNAVFLAALLKEGIVVTATAPGTSAVPRASDDGERDTDAGVPGDGRSVSPPRGADVEGGPLSR